MQVAAHRKGSVAGRKLVRIGPVVVAVDWLAGLVAVDMLLIGAHVVLGATQPRIPPAFNIAYDFSLGESFNYAKWSAVVIALVAVATARRAPGLLAVALAFVFILADDSLQLHERFGHALASGALGPELGHAFSQDAGELAAMACIGTVLLVPLGWTYLREGAAGRAEMRVLVGLIALLAVFAAGVDQAHGLFRGLPYGIQIADLLEDGGEMLVGSLIAAHALALVRLGAA